MQFHSNLTNSYYKKTKKSMEATEIYVTVLEKKYKDGKNAFNVGFDPTEDVAIAANMADALDQHDEMLGRAKDKPIRVDRKSNTDGTVKTKMVFTDFSSIEVTTFIKKC